MFVGLQEILLTTLMEGVRVRLKVVVLRLRLGHVLLKANLLVPHDVVDALLRLFYVHVIKPYNVTVSMKT